MFTVAIALILATLIFVRIAYKADSISFNKRSLGDWVIWGFFYVVLVFLVGLTSAGVAFFASNYAPKVTNTYNTHLVSFKGEAGISGKFILGTGSVKSTAVYSFNRPWGDDGAIVNEQITASYPGDVRIYQDATPETANLVWDIVSCDSPWDAFVICPNDYRNYRFHVPAGTVGQQFDLNQ